MHAPYALYHWKACDRSHGVNIPIQAEEWGVLMLSFLLLIVTLCGWTQEYTYRIVSVES